MHSPPLGRRTRRRLSFLINFVFWALWILLFLATGRMLIRWLLPFVAAFALAAVLQKPLSFLERRFSFTHGFAATAVTTVTLVAGGGSTAAAGYYGGVWLLRLLQTDRTALALQACGERLHTFLDTFLAGVATRLPADIADTVTATLSATRDALAKGLAAALTSLSGKLLSFATDSLPRLLLAALFFVLALVFFTRDYNKITAFCLRQIPAPQKALATAAAIALRETTLSTLKAYLLLGLVTAAEMTAGFWLLGLPLPLLWAILTALLDALPVLGVGTVLFPLAVFFFAVGDTAHGIGTLVLYGAATASHHLLQPRFLSRETGLPPLITLLTMYAGWRAAGIIGLLAAPVLAMVILRLQREGHLHIFH